MISHNPNHQRVLELKNSRRISVEGESISRVFGGNCRLVLQGKPSRKGFPWQSLRNIETSRPQVGAALKVPYAVLCPSKASDRFR